MSRRALTFLEVVFATALVAMIAATLTGLFSYVNGQQRREQYQLACAEVANRLMLNYLDNPAAMPDPGKVVEYGTPRREAHFRWELDEQRVRLVEARPEGRDETRASPLKRDRMKLVSIRVWLSEQSGGARRPDGTIPTATLARIVDPLALRNPDSMDNMMKDPAARQKWMEAMMGFSAAQAVSQGGASIAAGGKFSSTAGASRRGGGKNLPSPREAMGGARTTRDNSGAWAYEQWGGPGKVGR